MPERSELRGIEELMYEEMNQTILQTVESIKKNLHTKEDVHAYVDILEHPDIVRLAKEFPELLSRVLQKSFYYEDQKKDPLERMRAKAVRDLWSVWKKSSDAAVQSKQSAEARTMAYLVGVRGEYLITRTLMTDQEARPQFAYQSLGHISGFLTSKTGLVANEFYTSPWRKIVSKLDQADAYVEESSDVKLAVDELLGRRPSPPQLYGRARPGYENLQEELRVFLEKFPDKAGFDRFVSTVVD